jgi:hypothetical protein
MPRNLGPSTQTDIAALLSIIQSVGLHVQVTKFLDWSQESSALG